MMNIEIDGLKDITINIDGTVLASQDFKNWPTNGNGRSNKLRYLDFWQFDNCDGLTFES